MWKPADNLSRDPDGLQEVLALLVEGVRARLGTNYVGTYLQGSIATGGFDEASDVDFLVAVNEELSETTVAELQAFHRELYGHQCYWAQHLEGSYATRADLATLPPPRRKLWYLDHGSTTFERSDHDHYLAVLWTLRERGVTLDGPPPDELVPEISPEALKNETRHTMREWAQQIFGHAYEMTKLWYTAFAVLSYARMACTVATGEVVSKQHGAAWAKRTMAQDWHALIDRAAAARHRSWDELLGPADPAFIAETKAFIRHVLAEHA